MPGDVMTKDKGPTRRSILRSILAIPVVALVAPLGWLWPRKAGAATPTPSTPLVISVVSDKSPLTITVDGTRYQVTYAHEISFQPVYSDDGIDHLGDKLRLNVEAFVPASTPPSVDGPFSCGKCGMPVSDERPGYFCQTTLPGVAEDGVTLIWAKPIVTCVPCAGKGVMS
jgi:hypothetical protein